MSSLNGSKTIMLILISNPAPYLLELLDALTKSRGESSRKRQRKRQRKMQELRKSGVRKAGGKFEPSTETLGMRGGGREETPEPLYHEAFPAHTPGTTRVYRGGDMESLKKGFNPLTGKPNPLAVQSMWRTQDSRPIAKHQKPDKSIFCE